MKIKLLTISLLLCLCNLYAQEDLNLKKSPKMLVRDAERLINTLDFDKARIVLEKAVEQIKGYIESLLAEEKEIFLVDMIQKGTGSTAKLIVLLDGDQGVTIDQCASISRQTSHFIDEESDLTEPLTLEVSSAGLDHPLKLIRQYFKNIGNALAN